MIGCFACNTCYSIFLWKTIFSIRKCKLSIRDLCGIIVPVLIGIVLLMRKGKAYGN